MTANAMERDEAVSLVVFARAEPMHNPVIHWTWSTP
jgi:hypothetical protein